ncbi:MAG: hypothetical protein LBH09_08035 [Peptococcaceae bacterium]|jgi:hypothetical protein|nr:hypothetical protein [Peptococcaceae bacterium]
MDRTEQIFTLIKPLSRERFKQSKRLIENHCENFGNEIAAEIISAFRNAFVQAADLQRFKEKGAVQYLILSHLYSSVWLGGYSVKLDIFDNRLYADPHEIDAYLTMDWLHGFLADDMAYFKKVLVTRISSLQAYELEQVKYRHVYYYHAAALALIAENIPALLRLPEFGSLIVDPEFEVLFGGYMDKTVAIWPKVEEDNEVFSA